MGQVRSSVRLFNRGKKNKNKNKIYPSNQPGGAAAGSQLPKKKTS